MVCVCVLSRAVSMINLYGKPRHQFASSGKGMWGKGGSGKGEVRAFIDFNNSYTIRDCQ